MMTVYLISEENHGTIGVCDRIGSGVFYLLQNDWISPLSEVAIGDKAIPLWRYLGFTSRKSCEIADILSHFLTMSAKETIEELELLGFYFYDYKLIE